MESSGTIWKKQLIEGGARLIEEGRFGAKNGCDEPGLAELSRQMGWMKDEQECAKRMRLKSPEVVPWRDDFQHRFFSDFRGEFSRGFMLSLPQ